MRIICVGRNYTDHIKELENQRPESHVLFHKPDSSIILKNRPFFIPDFSNEIHYELELIIKISRIGKHIQTKFSHKYYDFIGLGIDFTARDIQSELKKNSLPWEKAKAFDGSCFVSDWIEKSKFNDLNNTQSLYLSICQICSSSTRLTLCFFEIETYSNLLLFLSQ